MTKRDLTSPFAFPIMMARLTAASWETIFHRSLMMAQGTCSAVEYQRMAMEKTEAAQKAMTAMMTGGSPAAVMAPYVTRARANAKRLRRKG
jgi:ribosomal protein S12 methylthiotransferase accessory factor YcaO